MIAVGLALLGIGAPMTVAIAKFFRNGKPNISMVPGHANACIEHRTKMFDLQLQLKSLSDNVTFVRESVTRIEGELEKIRDKFA